MPPSPSRGNCVTAVGHHSFALLRYGGGERDRTDDLLLAKQALSQLSYTPSLRAVHRPKTGGGRRQENPQDSPIAARRRIGLQAAAPSLARSLS
jgi:hypothetical protein